MAKKNLKAKGQAFIVFEDIDAASRAVKEVQGFELFDKPMLLDYAKTSSDATVAQNGSEEDLEMHKRRRLAEKGTDCSPHLARMGRMLMIIRTQASIRG